MFTCRARLCLSFRLSRAPPSASVAGVGLTEQRVAQSITVAKADDARHLVFGWAMVAVRKDGATVVDHQGDWITQDDLADAAYDFVLNAGVDPVSGEQHDKTYEPDGYLVESVVFTDEKLAAMGIEADGVDRGHWIGLYIPDDEAYARVRDGEKPMLSIEATGYREDAEPPGAFVVAS